jgi:Lon protease-like protein
MFHRKTDLHVLPVFPLNMVLFPDGVLPLRIFEPRYVDLIRWCARGKSKLRISESGRLITVTVVPKAAADTVASRSISEEVVVRLGSPEVRHPSPRR